MVLTEKTLFRNYVLCIAMFKKILTKFSSGLDLKEHLEAYT